MKYVIDRRQRPAYLQLYRQLRDDVIAGIFPITASSPHSGCWPTKPA